MAANCVSVVITPGWAPVASCISGWGGHLQVQHVSLTQPPFKWLSLCWDVGCMRLCIRPWRGESASYSLLVLLYTRPAGLQSQICLGIIFPVHDSRLEAQCGVVTHCSLGRTSEVVNTLRFVGRLLWMWVLVLLFPLLLPICGSFFLSSVVENLFLLVFRSF